MLKTQLFRDRLSAGEQLAELVYAEICQLKNLGNCPSPIIYALPRGGIPIAIPIARKLACPLDIIVAKKITMSANRELAIGAVTTEGNVVWGNPKLLEGISLSLLQKALHQAQEKASDQLEEFYPYRPKVNPKNAIAILVDDGIATGMTITAAAQAMREHQVAQVWICAPVAPKELIAEMEQKCDRLIVLKTPHPFLSVSRFYYHFSQVAMETALAYLQSYNRAY